MADDPLIIMTRARYILARLFVAGSLSPSGSAELQDADFLKQGLNSLLEPRRQLTLPMLLGTNRLQPQPYSHIRRNYELEQIGSCCARSLSSV
jgi:hypothetical protein